MSIYAILLNGLTPEDEHVLGIFSLMFVFSALLVAGYTSVTTKQKGVRRALVSFLAFIASYAFFRALLHYGIAPHP